MTSNKRVPSAVEGGNTPLAETSLFVYSAKREAKRCSCCFSCCGCCCPAGLWGVAVSALISWFCKRVLGYQWRVFCGSPSRIWAMARYFAHLLAEMLKAGLVIMRIIYTRPKGIEPKLVWFHTPLKTDRRRAMLADSITLTAGTITVRAEDGRMLVHTLDTPLAEGIEDSSFQQRLERMEAAQWNK